MTERSVAHAAFTIQRRYPAAPAAVFKAFADPAARRRWFIDGEGWTIDAFEPAFAEGGRELSRFRFGDGPPMRNDTSYHEIVPDERILFSYAMTVDGRRMSVSLVTIVLAAEAAGTRLTYTEQCVFLDGADTPAEREAGCRDLLDALATELARPGKDA